MLCTLASRVKHAEVRGQFTGVGSRLLPFGSWGLKAGGQPWQQAPYLRSHLARPCVPVFPLLKMFAHIKAWRVLNVTRPPFARQDRLLLYIYMLLSQVFYISYLPLEAFQNPRWGNVRWGFGDGDISKPVHHGEHNSLQTNLNQNSAFEGRGRPADPLHSAAFWWP